MICTPCQESRHRMCEGGDCECPRRTRPTTPIDVQLAEQILAITGWPDVHTPDDPAILVSRVQAHCLKIVELHNLNQHGE